MTSIIIVMGVCGSGKTTVAQRLAEELQWQFHEADDSHSTANKEKMARGIALEDEDRWPWLLELHGVIQRWYKSGVCGVLTCSALRVSYRKVLLQGGQALPDEVKHNLLHPAECSTHEQSTNEIPLQNSVMLVHLTGDRMLLEKRINQRQDHYMPSTLLTSQLDTLEAPGDDEPHIEVDVAADVQCIVSKIIKKCKLKDNPSNPL